MIDVRRGGITFRRLKSVVTRCQMRFVHNEIYSEQIVTAPISMLLSRYKSKKRAKPLLILRVFFHFSLFTFHFSLFTFHFSLLSFSPIEFIAYLCGLLIIFIGERLIEFLIQFICRHICQRAASI